MSTDEWTTPRRLFDFLNILFDFKVDLAASEENKLCDIFFTKENSGLMADSVIAEARSVWCNPPYSLCAHFSRQARNWINHDAVYLMPVRSDRLWFVDWLEDWSWKHTWITGRLHFGNASSGAFMYNILFYKHDKLTLPASLSAGFFNENGKGGAKS